MFGMSEGFTKQEIEDVRFAAAVEAALGRRLTDDEVRWTVWELRDDAGLNALETAAELEAIACKEAA